MGQQVTLVAPVNLRLPTGDDLEAAVQTPQRGVVGLLQRGGDPRPGLGQEHLDPLVVTGEAVIGDQPLMDHGPFQRQSDCSHASIRSTNTSINRGWVPARDGDVGGTAAASSARYLRTVPAITRRRGGQHETRKHAVRLAEARRLALAIRGIERVSAYDLICRSPYDLTCRSVSAR
jgi:hypothetical protein